MNFKSLLVVGLGIATLGLSLPAHADTATVVTTDQTAIITGDGNVTVQSDNTSVTNRSRGTTRRVSNTGTVITKSQTADVAGDGNVTAQESTTTIRNNSSTVNGRRYRY